MRQEEEEAVGARGGRAEGGRGRMRKACVMGLLRVTVRTSRPRTDRQEKEEEVEEEEERRGMVMVVVLLLLLLLLLAA